MNYYAAMRMFLNVTVQYGSFLRLQLSEKTVLDGKLSEIIGQAPE